MASSTRIRGRARLAVGGIILRGINPPCSASRMMRYEISPIRMMVSRRRRKQLGKLLGLIIRPMNCVCSGNSSGRITFPDVGDY